MSIVFSCDDKPTLIAYLYGEVDPAVRAGVDAHLAACAACAAEVRALIVRLRLPTAHFHEVIAGCEMDLDRSDYGTWDELRIYCHRVASVVGLVSLEIFGAKDPVSRDSARRQTDRSHCRAYVGFLEPVNAKYQAFSPG